MSPITHTPRARRPPKVLETQVAVRQDIMWQDYWWTPQWGPYNITNQAQTSGGCISATTLTGSFGSLRPPKLVGVQVSDADNGDEVSMHAPAACPAPCWR